MSFESTPEIAKSVASWFRDWLKQTRSTKPETNEFRDDLLLLPDAELLRAFANLLVVGHEVLPTLVEIHLSQGTLEPSELDDVKRVFSVMIEYTDIFETLRPLVGIDWEFLDSAKDAIASDRPMVAIVLIATAVEHRLNYFYRQALLRQSLLSE